MRNERGFSLIEILVALLILAIVITTTIGMFTERQKRMRQANETVIAYQVLSNEAELWRRASFSSIDADFDASGGNPKFKTEDTPLQDILKPLVSVQKTVRIDKTSDKVRNITLTIRWAPSHEARLSIVRVDTGGTNLW